MGNIRKLLSLDDWSDFVSSSNGYAAKRRPDVAPFAYELVVNTPLDEETRSKLMEYAGGANEEMVSELYSMCNGIHVGATKFSVYGVIGQLDRDSPEKVNHIPFDINEPNIYGRPEGWPDSALIVGASWEQIGENERSEFLHCIEDTHFIRVVPEDDYDKVLRRYETVEEWLAKETERALRDTDNF